MAGSTSMMDSGWGKAGLAIGLLLVGFAARSLVSYWSERGDAQTDRRVLAVQVESLAGTVSELRLALDLLRQDLQGAKESAADDRWRKSDHDAYAARIDVRIEAVAVALATVQQRVALVEQQIKYIERRLGVDARAEVNREGVSVADDEHQLTKAGG